MKLSHVVEVTDCNLLMVGLDGFTIEDLAANYPNVQVGIHVKDGDEWIPVTIDQLHDNTTNVSE